MNDKLFDPRAPADIPDAQPAPVLFAVIDAETNGIFDYKKPADDPCQPRLANLGVLLLNEDLSVASEHEFLVKPDGWAMTPEATAVNGLTDEILAAEGQALGVVLLFWQHLVADGRAVASYGAQFDCKQMRGELRRAGLDDLFEKTPNSCLMRACQGLKIKKANGKGGWPGLDDALRHFGFEPEAKPHRALAGARKSAEVLRALAKIGKLPAPSVHFAKEKGEAK